MRLLYNFVVFPSGGGLMSDVICNTVMVFRFVGRYLTRDVYVHTCISHDFLFGKAITDAHR